MVIGSFLVVLLCLGATAGGLIYLFVGQPTTPPPTVKDYGNFGVIEIGTKGIKSYVVQEFVMDNLEGDFKIQQQNIPDNINPGMIVVDGKVDEKHLTKITTTVRTTIETMRREFQVADKQIYVVFSSGFNEQFNHDEKLEKSVKDQLAEKLMVALEWPEEQRKHVESIDEEHEGLYGSEVVIPSSKRKNGVHLDIGTGNLKGGYFDNNKRFQSFKEDAEDTYLGTGEFAKYIAKNREGAPFSEAASRHGVLLEKRLRNKVKKNTDLEERDTVYLNGGIAWVMTLCTHPDKGPKDDRRVPVESEDIAKFYQIVLDARVELKDAGLEPKEKADKEAEQSWKKLREAVLKSPKLQGATPEQIEWLNKQLKKPIFNNNELIAGAQILLALDSALEFKNKKLYLYRDGHLAWSLGYINTKVQSQASKKAK